MDKSKNRKPQIRFPEFKDDWEYKSLNELLVESKKRNTDLKYGKDKVLSVSGESGVVNQIEHLGRSCAGESVHNYHVVEPGNIVYTKSPLKANPYGIIKHNKGGAGIVSTLYAVYKVKEETAFGPFLDYYFWLNTNTNRYLRPLVKKGAKNDMKINNAHVLKGKIFTPSVAEQKRISSFLSILDEQINITSKTINHLSRYKRGITQKIFNQEIRFKDNNGQDFPEWHKQALGTLIVEVDERTTKSKQYPILSSTMKGIYLQSDYFTRDVASVDNTGYKILKKNQLVFSPQNLWLGNINICSNFDIGIVSPSYKIYTIKEDLILINYFRNIIKLPRMLYEYEISSEQGASVVRRNLNIDLFNLIPINIPSLQEQIKIADFLTSLDNLIESKQDQINHYKRWKRGLVQNLFIAI